jgi:hypothetical protein
MGGWRHFSFLEANGLEDVLSEVPVGSLKYAYPIEVVAAAFSLEWPSERHHALRTDALNS